MDPAIRQALTWTMLGLSVVMAAFTWADISSGTPSTAMWISGVAWPVVTVICGVILRQNPYRSRDRQD